MIGCGAIVFAVWGYVIATARLDRKVGAQVALNPVLLGAILGESAGDVERAITFLCQPDMKSTSKEEEGRRLIRLGEFDYRVVNFAKYREMRDEEKRREQNRAAQEKFREKKKWSKRGKGGPLPGESETLRAEAAGREDIARQIEDTHIDDMHQRIGNQPGMPPE